MGTNSRKDPVKSSQTILGKAIRHAITGKGAHMEANDVIAGLDWKNTGNKPDGAPHSVFQLLSHIIFWQKWAIQWLDAKKPAIPKHASGS